MSRTTCLARVLVGAGGDTSPGSPGRASRATRACARPQSVDGRPLTGSVPGVVGLYLAAGNGPWGISCGPATARLAVDAILAGSDEPVPPDLRVVRMAAATRTGWPW